MLLGCREIAAIDLKLFRFLAATLSTRPENHLSQKNFLTGRFALRQDDAVTKGLCKRNRAERDLAEQTRNSRDGGQAFVSERMTKVKAGGTEPNAAMGVSICIERRFAAEHTCIVMFKPWQ
jgi:hypothetical protein